MTALQRVPFGVAVAAVALSLGACGEGELELTETTLHGDYREVPEEFQLTQALGSSGRAVLYLNFDGVTLKYGGSSSKQNSTWLVPQGQSVKIPAFSTGTYGNVGRQQAISQVVEWVRQDFRHWDAVITTERPTSGNYTMVAVGGRPNLIGEASSTVGLAPFDVGNANPNDVVFVFSQSIHDLRQLATCISHEAGHSFGLDHVEPKSAIMHPTLLSGTLTFQHAKVYGRSYWQDQPKILTGLFGSPSGTAPAPAPAPAPAATDASVYVSQELPSDLTPGETFLAKVTFKNTGTTTWSGGADYALMAPDSTWGGNFLAVSGSVAPGQTKTFAFYAKAPAEGGVYGFGWYLTRGGQKFGASSPTTTIRVNATGNRLPEGQFEFADTTWGYGWAWDPDSGSAAISVDVYINGNYAGSVKADRARDDLGSKGVVGRNHGFAFQMPKLPAGAHKVEIYAVDDKGEYAYKIPGEFFVAP